MWEREEMPTLAENKAVWDGSYDWPGGGDEWSEAWGSAEAQWAGCIYPRVFPFLAGRILEIAPGYGRWTQFLREYCDSLIGVDLSEVCVTASRDRFSGDSRLQFEVGDGLRLPVIPDASIDFAFSFDSLVHAEADVLESYALELARVLKPNGVAFLHHSNVASLPERSIWDRIKRRWARAPISYAGRAGSMSATLMREFTDRAGMSCVQQELIPWGYTGWPVLIDCMSTIVNAPGRPCAVIENRRFMEEASMIRRIDSLAPHVTVGRGHPSPNARGSRSAGPRLAG
jgi:SAM-dependent methyltransferase